MAEDKKGFILYADLIHTVKHLTNDQAGDLFKHVLSYVNDENPVSDNPITTISFEPIKQQLKRDLEKWGTTREGRSKAGKASAEAKRLKKERELTNSTNSTNVKSVQQTSTNPTVSDNVNVNVNVNVKDKVINNKPLKVFKDDIHFLYDSILPLFPTTTQPKNQKEVDSWKDELRKLVEIDKIDTASIEHVIKSVRSDPFWSKNFLTLKKLRQTDKNGIKYIIVFIEQFKQKKHEPDEETRKSIEHLRTALNNARR